MSNKHILWIDDARTLAMLLVIIGHCGYTDIMTPYGGVSYFSSIALDEYSLGWKLLNSIVAFVYGFHVPMFMVISGACFSLTIHKIAEFKSLVRNKSHKLLLPFLLTTLFLAVPLKYMSGYYEESTDVLRDIVLGQLLLMGNSHLWFVVSLFWIFLIYYGLYKWRITQQWWFLPAVTFLSVCATYFTNKGVEFLGLLLALKHFVYFAVGFRYLRKLDATEWGGQKLLLNIIVYICLFFVTTNFLNGNTHLVKLIRLAQTVVMGIYGSVIMIQVSKRFAALQRIKQSKCYTTFARNSYELYLFSDPFNYVLLSLTYSIMGDYVVSSIDSFIAFAVRFFGTILFALLVVRLKAIVRRKLFSCAS